MSYFIGLMSGTSLDGVDGVVLQFSTDAFRIVQSASQDFSAPLRAELLALNSSGPDELHRAALAANALAMNYGSVVQTLLAQSGLRAQEIIAVGAHGQTVRHCPIGASRSGAHEAAYTIQLNNPALLAELCGIDVVADLRSRDLAAGGQGAPLVPAFHRAAFGQADPSGAVINIGGISNISLLDPFAKVAGFDCGPGNALLDHWVAKHTGAAFDADGNWGASGTLNHDLLAELLSDPYFARKPPKSTGRDLFNPLWLDTKLQAFQALRPQDVQSTLVELSARSIRSAVCLHAERARTVVVCGGGARNGFLMRRISRLLPHTRVVVSDELGMPAQQVEAAAFAWLARQCVLRLPGNLPKATGASGPRVLGAIYPASCVISQPLDAER